MTIHKLLFICALLTSLQSLSLFGSEENNKNWCCIFKRNPYKKTCCYRDECSPLPIISGVITGISGIIGCACYTVDMTTNIHNYSCGKVFTSTFCPTDCSNTHDCCCSTLSWTNTSMLLTGIGINLYYWNPCCDDKGCNVDSPGCCPKKYNDLNKQPIEMTEDN